MTEKDKMRCMMLYTNAQFQIIESGWGKLQFDIEGFDLKKNCIISGNEYFPVIGCTLLLRHISSLTADEVLKIYESIGLKHFYDELSIDTFLSEFSPYVITETDDRHSSENYYKVYCQLLELNINMPVYGFDLVKEGVALTY